MKLKIIFVLIFSFLFLLAQNCASAKKNTAQYRVVQDSEGICVIEILTSKTADSLVPYVSENLETNFEIYNKTGAELVVNGGFFDPKNQKSVSYIVIDGNVAASPEDNENLMQNTVLQPYMNKILNRSEFRVLQDSEGRLIYDIARHNDGIPENFVLKHSIQAGPMLFPDLRLEEEFFVLVKEGKIVSESASALHKYARTAIGIRNNNVYIFIASPKAPLTLEELADLTRRWGMWKAMAFDGGGSTSFDSRELHIISEKNNEARKLKSFLILKNNSL